MHAFVRYQLSIKFIALIILSGIAVKQRATFEKEARKIYNVRVFIHSFTKKQDSN